MKESNNDIGNEITILKTVKHPNIVEFIGLKEVNDQIFIIMEFMNGGSLLQYIRQHENLKESDLVNMMQQIANGMAYLEQKKIIHL